MDGAIRQNYLTALFLPLFTSMLLVLPSITESQSATVDQIVERYRIECEVPFIDSETTQDREFSKGEDSVFDVVITPEGKLATVLFANCTCTDLGLGWCGSGGCEYYIVVDDEIEFRGFGYRPSSLTFGPEDNGTTLVLLRSHSTSCEVTYGNDSVLGEPCYDVIQWRNEMDAFVRRK